MPPTEGLIAGRSNGFCLVHAASTNPQIAECMQGILASTGTHRAQTPAPRVLHGIFGPGPGFGVSLPEESPKRVPVRYVVQVPSVTGFMMGSLPSSTVNTGRAHSRSSASLVARNFEYLIPEIKNIIASAELVEFDDGKENDFTKHLMNFVKDWGSSAVMQLGEVIFRSPIRSEVVGQVLLCLGRIEDKKSHLSRSKLLRRGLHSRSAKVRDAAAVGIASLGDHSAIEDLDAAIGRESIPSLKQDMRDVLEYLRTVK